MAIIGWLFIAAGFLIGFTDMVVFPSLIISGTSRYELAIALIIAGLVIQALDKRR